MNAQAHEISGHAKEVAGIVTGDDELKAEGRDERVAAQVEGAVDDAAKHVDAGIGATQDKVDGLFARLSHWVRRS
jgi:uncharacterized protein YjbJ (UPF0337 family)